MKKILTIIPILIFALNYSVFGLSVNQKKSTENQNFQYGTGSSGNFAGASFSDTLPDTLNLMGHWYNEDKRELFVRELVDDYKKENPEVNINLKFTQEIMEGKSKFKTAWFINEMIMYDDYKWDIVWIDDNIYQFVSENLGYNEWGKDHLVDFSKYDKFIEAHKSFIIEDSIYRNITGGIMIGPMIEGYYGLLWYNKLLADKMGLNIKDYGMTYEDFLDYVKKVHEYNLQHNSNYSAIYESYDWRTTGNFLFQQLFNSVVDYEEKSLPQKSSNEVRDIALLKTLQAFEELSKYNPLIKTHDKNQWFSTRDYILNDSCVFYLSGSWMYSHWKTLDSIKMKNIIAAELPVFHSSKTYLGGYLPTWGVMKNSPNRERAIDFLLFICQPKYADKWMQYTHTPCGLNGSTSLESDKTDKNTDINKYLKQTYGSNLTFSSETKYVFGNERYVTSNTFNEILIDILTREKTAQSAFDDFKLINE